MNVASLELCKELYELSGWYPEPASFFGFYWFDIDLRTGNSCEWKIERYFGPRDEVHQVPAYDLGYLLRKLQITADWTHGRFQLEHYCDDGTYEWGASYNSWDNNFPIGKADTPEDAAAKLAIELFKQGVLKR